MSINKTYAVFGLGRYGMAVATELVKSGVDVIAVDRNERLVASAAPFIPVCKCADVTDPDVIEQLGIANVDTVIIAMASSLEATVMAIMLCKEAGVETVIVKCGDEMHRKIFSKVGADQVVFPENESGIRLAKNLLSAGFVDMVELTENVSMIEMKVKPEWVGKSLIELNLRKKYSINVVGLKCGEAISTVIDPEKTLEADTGLIIIANTDKLKKLN